MMFYLYESKPANRNEPNQFLEGNFDVSVIKWPWKYASCSFDFLKSDEKIGTLTISPFCRWGTFAYNDGWEIGIYNSGSQELEEKKRISKPESEIKLVRVPHTRFNAKIKFQYKNKVYLLKRKNGFFRHSWELSLQDGKMIMLIRPKRVFNHTIQIHQPSDAFLIIFTYYLTKFLGFNPVSKLWMD